MRDGSREGVLSHETGESKKEEQPAVVANAPVYLRKRPDYLRGVTRRIATPVGHAFVTINEDTEGNPFEVFINVGKAGSDITADAEAIGRLISLALRIPTNYSPKEVVQQVVNQLAGIGGSSSRGFGIDRIHSLADALSKVLAEYSGTQSTYPTLAEEKVANGNGHAVVNGNGHSSPNGNGHATPNGNGHAALTNGNGQAGSSEQVIQTKEPLELTPVVVASSTQGDGQQVLEAASEKPAIMQPKRFDLCPKCGVASFVHEEGCSKCMNCGHSEC
jgi:ribonucleoside-diphosphate reductase alpha chain